MPRATRIPLRTTFGLLLAALLALTVALGLPQDALGQEGPTPTSEAPPATQPALILRPPEDMPVSVGDELEVRLDIENVEHLAAFDAFISFDFERLEWGPPDEQAGDSTPAAGATATEGTNTAGGAVGTFFTDQEREDLCFDSPRGEVEFHGSEGDMQAIADALVAQGHEEKEVIQTTAADGQFAVIVRVTVDEMGPAIDLGVPFQTRVVFDCITVSAPISAGGPPGIAGSGTLGTIRFRAIEGGDAAVDFDERHTLVSDDLNAEGEPDVFEHSVQGTVIEISSGGSQWTMIGIIIAVVAVVVIGGAAGFWWARSRSSSDPRPSTDA